MKKVLGPLAAIALLLPVGAYAADTLTVDNLDPGYVELSGTWFGSTYGYLDSSRWCVQDTTPFATARWTPACSTADKYNVYYIVPLTDNASTSALYVVHHATGNDSAYKDQNKASGEWIFLGAYDMPGDSSGYVDAVNDTTGATGWAFRADAVLWEAVGDTQDIHCPYFYHDFALVDIDDSLDWTFDISNVGGDDLVVDSVVTSTAEFIITNPAFPQTLLPGATLDITVRFAPTAGGSYADSVEIFSDDPDEPKRVVEVVGKSGVLLVDDDDPGYSEPVGIWGDSGAGWNGSSRWIARSANPNATARWTPDVPDTNTFNAFFYLPSTTNSSTNAKYVVVHTGGRDSLYLDQNRGSGQWIFLGQHLFSAGTGGYVEVVNDPSVVASGYAFRADAVKLEAPTETQDIYVIDWSHNFGEVTQGTPSDWIFTAHNVGAVNLTVDSIRTTDPAFSIPSPATPTIVSPGAALDITVRFTPPAQQAYSATVTVYSDDPLEPSRSLSVNGVGVGQVVIVDNEDGPPWYTESDTSDWATSGSAAYGANSRYAVSPRDTAATATWTPVIPVADYYEVYWIIVYTDWTDQNALYIVNTSDGKVDSMRVNQEYCLDWTYLGTYYFDTDTSGSVTVVADNLCVGEVVRADAIKFLQAKGDLVPPEISGLEAEKSSGDIHLSWRGEDYQSGINHYIIFRNTSAYFTPTSGDSIGESATTSYLDIGAAGTVGTNYYYAAQAVDNVGLKSGYSNQVGEFDRSTVNVK